MKYTLAFLLLICLYSCRDADNTKAPLAGKRLEKAVIWNLYIDSSSQKFKVEALRTVWVDTVTPALLIKNLNQVWTRIQAELSGIKHDTVIISIPNSAYLTEQMGSGGPTCYFGSATRTLLQLHGIDYVKFDFEDGEHASPLTCNRDDFDINDMNER